MATRHDLACSPWRKRELRDDESAFQELLADEERVLGADHGLTRGTRHNLRRVRDDMDYTGGGR